MKRPTLEAVENQHIQTLMSHSISSRHPFPFAPILCTLIASLNPINSTLSRTAFLISLALATITLFRHFRPRFPRLTRTTLSTKTEANLWFHSPVTLHRWCRLTPQ